jgi:hypothetical protein
MLFTIQEKCLAYVGKSSINDTGNYLAEGRKKIDFQFTRLVNERERQFRSFFKETSTGSRIRFNKEDDRVPFNGFSFYKIDYKGDIPKKLKKAYMQMNDINGNN